MRSHTPSLLLICTLVATQVIGPATLWAAEERSIQIDKSRRAVIAAIDGTQLTVRNGQGVQPVQFREVVNVGEYLTTGNRTVAELLIGNRAVVTMGNDTALQLLAVNSEQTTIQVMKGMARVAAAASVLGQQGVVTVQIPTGQVQTRGGIVRVLVEAPVGKAESLPTGQGKAYPASYTSKRMAAVTSSNGELIQVDEGTAEILAAGGKTVTLQTGQSVTLQAGKAGVIGEGILQNNVRPGLVATVGHNQTPKEGRDYLVALQIDQASKLGTALIGPAKTGNDDSEKRKDTKNVINGATGGVTLQTQGALAKAFRDGGFFSGTGGKPVDSSGSAVIDDGSNQGTFFDVDNNKIEVSVKGGAGLLLFTERPNPGTFIPSFGGESDPKNRNTLNKFTATKELLLVDGGDKTEAPHQGVAPISTLVARATDRSSPQNVALGLQVAIADEESSADAKAIAEVGLIQPGEKDPPPTDTRPLLVEKVVKLEDEFGSPISPIQFTEIPCGQGGEGNDCYGTGESALSDFSNRPDGKPYIGRLNSLDSFVDGVISARSATTGNRFVTLKGGVVLDRGTAVTVGDTKATDAYFLNKANPYFTTKPELKVQSFNGSLLSVLASQDGGFKPAFVKIQDRALGVLDGSSIIETNGKKTALLSVLDSRLIGPGAKDPSTGAKGRKPGEIAPLIEMDGVLANGKSGARPSATVTSAVVVRATDVPFDGPLDGALLSASSPLLAMMHADMTTKSHFADLAGNNGRPALLASLVPGDALVRLNNAALTINGNLLNLNNATAAVTGYLFSLTNGSTLQIGSGSLFSLNNSSSLTLTGNAFGVLGDGASTLTINNNLCSTGPCGDLVNSGGQDILLNGVAIRVAGVPQDVVIPNNFNVFAGNKAATVTLGKDAALFHIDPTSTLTINGTTVK